MKKKVRNNKVILASILALGCLTAASVGFSSWVIAAQNTDATSNVNVTVADVKDHRFKVTASSSDSTIQLGPSTEGKYISYSGGKSEEALDFNFKLTFTTANGGSEAFDFTSLGEQSFNINFSFTNTLDINKDGNEYIKFPSEPSETTIGIISKSGFTASSSGAKTDTQSSNVITYNGKLAWGSYFDHKNPSELDDSTVSKDSTKVDSYIAGLKHLKECLKDNAAVEITVNRVKAV